jgi:hypothetical protein
MEKLIDKIKNGSSELLYEEDSKAHIASIFELKDFRLQKYKLFAESSTYYVKKLWIEDGLLKYYAGVYQIKVGAKAIYSTRISVYGFSFDGKKLNGWYGTKFTYIKNIIKSHAKTLGVEWIKAAPWELFTKKMVINTLSGKLTNPIDALKCILKNKMPAVDIPAKHLYKVYRRYIDAHIIRLFIPFSLILSMLKYEKYPHKLIEHVLNLEDDSITYRLQHTWEDILQQCKILDVKVSFTWSKTRLQNEHNKLNKEIIKLLKPLMGKTEVIYSKELRELTPPFKAEILDTELKAYVEGSRQHNCVYTSYWEQINSKQYIIYAANVPEGRVNVGINLLSNDSPQIHQIYLTDNKPASTDTIKQFKNWLMTEDVSKIIKKELNGNTTQSDELIAEVEFETRILEGTTEVFDAL